MQSEVSTLQTVDYHRHVHETSPAVSTGTRMSAADVAASETDNSAEMKSTQLRHQKNVDYRSSQPPRHHLIAFVIAAFCHFARPTDTQGNHQKSSFTCFYNHSAHVLEDGIAVHGKSILELPIIPVWNSVTLYLACTRHTLTRPALTSAKQASIRFIYPGEMEG